MISEMQMARRELSKSSLPLHNIQTLYDSIPKRIFRVLPILFQKYLRHLESERSVINMKHSSKISGVFAIHVTVGHFENSFNHPIVILLHVLNLERCSSKIITFDITSVKFITMFGFGNNNFSTYR